MDGKIICIDINAGLILEAIFPPVGISLVNF